MSFVRDSERDPHGLVGHRTRIIVDLFRFCYLAKNGKNGITPIRGDKAKVTVGTESLCSEINLQNVWSFRYSQIIAIR